MSKDVSEIDQLFIRACKSRSHQLKRVEWLYRRFYLGRENVEGFIAGVLCRIADQYLDLRPSFLIQAFSPDEACLYGIRDQDSHDLKTIKILISKIALTHRDKFPGLRAPAAIRRVS